MKIYGIKCTSCKETIYSRANYDFHRCKCKTIAVDGGPLSPRFLGNPGEYDEVMVTINVSEEQLYADWNLKIDKLGVIPAKAPEK